MRLKYSMLIQWSEEDQVYVVSLPEFPHCQTHGATYEEAARNGQDALECLVDTHEQGEPALPEPMTLDVTSTPWSTLKSNVAESLAAYKPTKQI